MLKVKLHSKVGKAVYWKLRAIIWNHGFYYAVLDLICCSVAVDVVEYNALQIPSTIVRGPTNVYTDLLLHVISKLYGMLQKG